MEITEVRLHIINKDSLKAFASITFDGLFCVTGITIREGRHGLFVSMPQRKVQDGTYKDIVFPLTRELREQITEAVLHEYGAEVSDLPF